jgi:acetyl esterase/lipase
VTTTSDLERELQSGPHVAQTVRGMPAALAARLRELGPSVDVHATAALYTPLLAQQARGDVQVLQDQRYGAHQRQVLDVYLPAPAAAGERRPTLVCFHGGGFIRGDKRQRENFGWFFASQGVLTLLPNYRLAPESRWPSGPEDVVAVWHWLQTHAARLGSDPARSVLLGESAGAAHVAAACLLRRYQPADWKIGGAILLSGPYNARLEGLARSQFGVATPDPRNEAYFGPDLTQWDACSIVDGIDAVPFPLLISMAELDLLQMQVQAGELFARLVSRHGFAPQLQCLRDHNHFSQGDSVGTTDTSVSGPVLNFVRAHT